jgi:hypothetical protein
MLCTHLSFGLPSGLFTSGFASKNIKVFLCTISDFQGSDNEECRLLGYKNPVRTSQETHYVSAIEHNRLMLNKS